MNYCITNLRVQSSLSSLHTLPPSHSHILTGTQAVSLPPGEGEGRTSVGGEGERICNYINLINLHMFITRAHACTLDGGTEATRL